MPQPDKFSRIFDLLDDIRERLSRLEAISPERKDDINAIDERLREVEIVVHKQMGASAVAGGALGLLGGIIAAVVGALFTR